MQKPSFSYSDSANIIRTRSPRDLIRIKEDCVQAVIYQPKSLVPWISELAQAVESGRLVVPRTVLPSVSAAELAVWLTKHLQADCIGACLRDALIEDILSLVFCLKNGARADRFMVRIFTASPTADCGFHVDTVPRGVPAWGLLRVYNGAGTAYVDPANVTSIREFQRYLSRRERLERERDAARRDGNLITEQQIEDSIGQLDEARSFLERPDEVSVAPAGSIVAFKHVEIGQYWSAYQKSNAWIHCSPMHGEPRLVVNITCPGPVRYRSHRAEHNRI